MTTIQEVANIVRSKNAGPYRLTFDIFFSSNEVYNRTKKSDVIDPSKISEIYEINEDEVDIYMLENLNCVKISIPRTIVSGSTKDPDIYGMQQYKPLLELELD